MKKSIYISILSLLLLCTHLSAFADDKEKAEKYVNDSLATLTNFANDPDMSWFRNHIQDAKGILIIPNEITAAFLVGGSGGTGVFSKHLAGGNWSYPAFYGMGAVTAGFQAGGQASEVVLLIMTDKGMDAMLSTKFQLGADVSVSAGPVGIGTAVATTDIVQFIRSKGVYAGTTIEGAIISPRNKLNAAYYGKEVSPLDVLVQGAAINQQADPLRAKLGSLIAIPVSTYKCPKAPAGAKVDKDGCWAFHGAVFGFDSADIKPESYPMVDNVVEVLKANPDMNIEIQGHTDSSGNAEYNMGLSVRRANAVKDYLVDHGISSSRLTVKGLGATQPVVSNDTANGRAYNRRVNIEITK
jgi:SH3 domain-containing YSC84-like protein 1